MDTLALTPYIINGILGGIIGPIVEEAAVTAAEKSVSNPCSSIALISIVPRPAASATADPLIPAKTTLASTLACPKPPGIHPTSPLQKSKIRLVILPTFISFPAIRKNGIAIRENPLTPFTIFCTMVCICRTPNPPVAYIPTIPVIANA